MEHYNKPHAASSADLSQQLLLAMPGMVSGNLANTVIYLCEHTEHGALGLVINRPTDLTVGNLLQRIDLDLSLEIGPIQEAPVFFGGPVQTDRGFVLHAPVGEYSSSIRLGELALTTSRDILQEVAQATARRKSSSPWAMRAGGRASWKARWRKMPGSTWGRPTRSCSAFPRKCATKPPWRSLASTRPC